MISRLVLKVISPHLGNSSDLMKMLSSTSNAMDRKSTNQSTGLGCFPILLPLSGLVFIWVMFKVFVPDQATYSRNFEGPTMVGSMNRAQQGYYLEEKKFSKDFEDLGLGVQPETEHYLLSTRITDKAAFNYVISHDKDVPSYVGGVFSVSLNEVESDASSNEMTMLAIICEANISGPTIPLLPTYQNGELACGEGTTDFSTIKSYY